jgi:hypothetical protein
MHAPLVQHGLLHQLLVQSNALQDRSDLVAEDRVASDPIGAVERRDAQELGFKRHRKDQEGAARFEVQGANRQQAAGGKARVGHRHHLPVHETDHRHQLGAVVAERARQERRANPGRGQALDQRVPERREIEGDRGLLADREQGRVAVL